MRAKQILLTLAVIVGFGLAAASANAAPSEKFLGTWNLDLSNMPADAGPVPKSITLVTEDAGDGKWKSSVTTVAADGTSSGDSVTYAVDGKDYPVTGNPNADTNAFTSPDPNTLVIVAKKGGKLVDTITTKLSEDGNTQNATTVAIGPDGKEMTTTGKWTRK